MISYLIGKITYKSPTELILDVNGVGYHINISLTSYEKFANANENVKVFTYLNVREDALQLFGFADESEREMFRLLISVSGIGPKIAQSMLSGLSAEELKNAIQKADINLLTSVPGIGKKTAERLIVELKDKISKSEIEILPAIFQTQESKVKTDAVNALVSLGYNRMSAENAVKAVLKENKTEELSVEDLIRLALRKASKA